MRSVDAKFAMQKFLTVSRHFNKLYEESRAEWHPEEPPLTIVFGDFGHSLGDLQDRLTSNELIAIWELVEFLLMNGCQEVQDAVATGFVEAVINLVDCGRLNGQQVIPHLGPETVAYWKAWDEFTGNQTNGLP